MLFLLIRSAGALWFGVPPFVCRRHRPLWPLQCRGSICCFIPYARYKIGPTLIFFFKERSWHRSMWTVFGTRKVLTVDGESYDIFRLDQLEKAGF